MAKRPGSASSKAAWDDADFDGGRSRPETGSEFSSSPLGRGGIARAPVIDIKDESNAGGWWQSIKACFRKGDGITDKDMHIKATIREAVAYIIFLIIVAIITFGMTSSTFYNYTSVMKGLFTQSPNTPESSTTFEGIASMNDLWDFIGSSEDDNKNIVPGAFQSALFAWDTWYNGQSSDQPGYVYHVNKILGVPRIRQLKVRNDSCTIPGNFKKDITVCHDDYSSGKAEKRPLAIFGNTTLLTNQTAWIYTKDTNGTSYDGTIASYDAGGYYVDLSRDAQTTADIINELKNNLWIDRGTRAVIIDLTVYNANINLFSVIKLIVELPATGGAFPHAIYKTVKLLRYVTPFDYFVAACEVFFIIFLVYFTVEELMEVARMKLAYLKSLWNWLDTLVVILGYVAVGLSINRMTTVDKLLDDLLTNPDAYANFDAVASLHVSFNNIMAILVFFAWVKIFKYIQFNLTMTQLASTLSGCAKDLAGFAVMFLIIFLAFAQLAYLLFGSQVEQYSTFTNSLFTLFRIILGDFDFLSIQQANRFLGPAFFILYIFFVFFVLINMFLAIINDTYADVKENTTRPEFELSDFMKKSYDKMLDKLNLKKDRIVDIQMALKASDANKDENVDYEEWRRELKSRGYAENEIEAMFAKFDNDGDRALNRDEQVEMMKQLEIQKDAIDNEMRKESSGGLDTSQRSGGGRGSMNGVGHDDFALLTRRVDRLEDTIGNIVSKIDAVLNKLEGMDKNKAKRREAMSTMLDSIRESDASEEQKRQRVEQLIRQELEKWDQEATAIASTATKLHSRKY